MTGGGEAAKFTMVASPCALYLVSAPDYVHSFPTRRSSDLDVVVQVSDGTNIDSQAIAVSVSNVNDNAPIISSNGGGATAAITIAENSTAVNTGTAHV